EPFLRAVGRLPLLSIVLYPAKGAKVYLPVEATDPVVEALRTAGEQGLRRAFVEPDLGDGPSYRQRYPDTYAITRLGPAAFAEACRLHPPDLDFDDRRRASGMAQHLRRLLDEQAGEVLC